MAEKPASNTDNFDRIKNIVACLIIAVLLIIVGAVVVSSPDYRASIIEMIPFLEDNKGISITKDVKYAKEPATVGDIYTPVNLKNRAPAAVVVHGGGWCMGSRNDQFEKGIARYLARNGFIAYNIDYPLVLEGGGFPKDIQAAKDAVLFLKSNASKFQVDPEEIFLLGYSSGAQIALMAAYTKDDKTLAPTGYEDQKLPVKAVAAYAAPSNLVDDDHRIIRDYLRDFKEMNEKQARKYASPISHVSNAVPTILLHGTDDTNVPIHKSEALMKEFAKYKIPSKMVRLEGGDHFIGPVTREATMKQVVNFFNAILKSSKSAGD